MDVADQPEGLKVGIDEVEIELDSRDQLAGISVEMLGQARRTLDLVSRHLDPGVYDQPAFVEALKQLALSSRHARIRILVMDPEQTRNNGLRLIELAQRLSTYITIRVPAPEHRDFNQAFMLVDELAYTYRRFADRYEGQACFSDRRRSRDLGDQFTVLWDQALPDPNFRRLHL